MNEEKKFSLCFCLSSSRSGDKHLREEKKKSSSSSSSKMAIIHSLNKEPRLLVQEKESIES
jgi:hypothetical protein